MNSLNIVSRLGITPPPSPPRSRSESLSQQDSLSVDRAGDTETTEAIDDPSSPAERAHGEQDNEAGFSHTSEKTPLVGNNEDRKRSRDTEWRFPKRVTEAVFYGVRAVLLTLSAPFRYVVACFLDEHGAFSAVMPLTSLNNVIWRRKHRPAADSHAVDSTSEDEHYDEKYSKRPSRKPSVKQRSPSISSIHSSGSYGSTEGEAEDSPARNTRSKTSTIHQDEDDDGQPRKSIRIKMSNDESLRRRKAAKGKRLSMSEDVAAVASALKSPSSAAASMKLTRYPRAPAPPRPLVPRRQPSYAPTFSAEAPRKTLIIDLDETLIHSMAKGGRMSTGHMVEVRLGGSVSGGGVQIGPGVPILYYVHERPGCHEFLRKVCKWYNLIVFTASVQEYADPVIDWLERERKYFSGRYYRQHCTFRNGAYIKDLAQVEPDLSKVMILDNSPMSYIFHEDNAVPIEGWISDPTDNDLLHLIPLFEGLQYVTDVRALLALRQGQAQQA